MTYFQGNYVIAWEASDVAVQASSKGKSEGLNSSLKCVISIKARTQQLLCIVSVSFLK